MVSNTRTLNPIVLLALVSCFCWSVGANVITTVPPVADTVAAPPNVVNEPTLAPSAAGHSSVAPVIHKESVGHNAAVVPVTTTIAPAIVPAHSSAPSHTTSAPQAAVITSVKPIVATNATNAEPIVSTGAAALAGNASAKETHCAGFCDYMKPICESLSKISSKQLFKIQTQFKQFVEKTNGKMSMCLVEHYQLDPTFKPVTHEDLNTICASRMQLDGAKGSFHAFQACAANHWDPELDKELALIREARANSTAHQHADSQVAAANIEHEDEELSMINEVVNKVLGQNGNLNKNNSDVKVIDVSGKTTLKPSAANAEQALNATAVDNKSTVAPANKSLLNDPNNTVMVFVDDAKTTLAPAILVSNNTTIAAAITTVAPSVNKTTVAPTHAAHVNSTTLHPAINITTSTIKPTVNSTTHVEVKKTHSTNSTTPLPVLSTKAPAANVTTTSKPLIESTNATTTVAPATTLTPTVNVTMTHASSNVTTTKPTASSSTSTVAPTKIASATTKAAVSTSTVKPTLKPIETLEQILKRQEKEKQDLDIKLKAERTQAINKLKKQDDAKIHQMEHERQMSLDPIGHTIKHQQYEAAKQRKVNFEKQ